MKRILSKKSKKAKLSTKRAASLLALILALVMSMMAFTSCGGDTGSDAGSAGADIESTESADTITITDHADRQVEVPKDIQRIAVCDIFPLPSVLTVFFDSADKIVGMPAPSMTAAQNGLLGQLYPEILNAETGYIDGSDINMEELMKLEPNVVFYSASSPEIGDQLTNAGLAQSRFP